MYLERRFGEQLLKIVEIIYLSINLLLVQTKLWQGIFVFKVIFSINIEHSKNKSICKGKEIMKFTEKKY